MKQLDRLPFTYKIPLLLPTAPHYNTIIFPTLITKS